MDLSARTSASGSQLSLVRHQLLVIDDWTSVTCQPGGNATYTVFPLNMAPGARTNF